METKTLRDIFVITPTHAEFERLLGDKNVQEHWDYELKNRMVHWVHNHMDFVGVGEGTRVFVAGQYFERPDWDELYLQIQIRKLRMLKLR